MANPIETFMRIRLDRFDAETAKRMHIEFARRKLAEFMARQSVKPMVSIEVDHRPALTENEVKPFGLIYYRFSRMTEVIKYALAQFAKLAPIGGAGDQHRGLYRRSFIMLVNNEKSGNINQIPPRAVVTIVNTQPYGRKVHVGSKGFEVTKGLVEKVRQLVLRKYGRMVTANIKFVELSPGYRLRKAPRAGQMLTTPALVIAPQ